MPSLQNKEDSEIPDEENLPEDDYDDEEMLPLEYVYYEVPPLEDVDDERNA
jgi:hypothetical protein